MTNDELAEAFRADFSELHAKIDALPDGALKRRASRLANVAHGAMNELHEIAIDAGQTRSGGEPKPGP